MNSLFIKRTLIFLVVIVVSFPSWVNAKETISLPGKANAEELPVVLLREIVRRNPEYELKFPYNDYEGRISKSRLMSDIESGALDTFWSSTNQSFEDKFRPVRIPIYRGLLGYRIAIIRKGNEDIFRNVKTLEDLKRFKAGQGLHWADTKILRHNGITVVTTSKSPNLYPMLEGGRFDFFPRGINQPWRELERYSDIPLTIEPRIMIRYPGPNYFFLNASNRKLWDLINNSLEEMYADGTYQRLFKTNKAIIDAIEKANIQERLIFDIENPSLPPQTPLDRKELWFDPLVDTL